MIQQKHKQHKYHAKPVYYHPSLNLVCKQKKDNDAIYFDSTFECRVFRKLIALVGIKYVHRQVHLPIKPASGRYPELTWKCDFRIYKPSDSSRYLNVEAKGMLTPEFKRNLQYLEYFAPQEFTKLMVIADECYWIDSCIQTWKLDNAITFLQKIGYFD